MSWARANLYVLDLCGRSNLTKIHTSLSSRSRGPWLMRTTYVRESERGEKEKRGETELEEGGEMTNRWRQTVGRKEIEKKGSTWLTVPPPQHPTSALCVLKKVEPRQMTHTFIYPTPTWKSLLPPPRWLWKRKSQDSPKFTSKEITCEFKHSSTTQKVQSLTKKTKKKTSSIPSPLTGNW